MRQWRALLVLILLLGALTASRAAVAQSAGSALAEAVAADAAGDNAYLSLESIEAFPPDGGEAFFEPGTENEEAFTYATIDAEMKRLVGLTRPEPTAHSLGAFVEAPSAPATGTPDPFGATPPPAEESPERAEAPGLSPSGSDGGGELGSQEPTAPDDAAADTSGPPDPCVEIKGTQTCASGVVDAVIDVIFSNCEGNLCEVAQDPCGEIGCDVGDPCDPHNTGQTCPQYIAGLIHEIEDFLGSAVGDPCDGGSTGEECPVPLPPRCEDVANALSSNGSTDWLVDLLSIAAALEDCSDDLDEDAYLPALPDVVGASDGIGLNHGKCDPGIGIPYESPASDSIVEGAASLLCGKQHALLDVFACLEKKVGGQWVRLKHSCRSGYGGTATAGHPTYADAYPQTACTAKPRRFRTWAVMKAVNVEEEVAHGEYRLHSEQSSRMKCPVELFPD